MLKKTSIKLRSVAVGRVSAPRLREGRTVTQERLVPQALPHCRWHTSRVSKSLPEP